MPVDRKRRHLPSRCRPFSSGAKTRGEGLRVVAQNQEFSRNQSNRAFVLMQYFGYLRRNPDDPPDSDFAGHAFWLGKLDQFNGNFVQAEMVKAFLVAGEYRQPLVHRDSL